jgi:radical SAM protein (TIGR01212 family)
MNSKHPNGYLDLNTYLRRIFGERVQKIALDAGMTCPNRDGTISYGGCAYCDRRGSGSGALIDEHLSIPAQIERGMLSLQRRYKARRFIAYFQSFSNTYAPAADLKRMYDQALGCPEIVGLAVATRPDCVDDRVLDLLSSYRSDYLVWIEMGLQSCHDRTLARINRGHNAAAFSRAAEAAHAYGLDVCVHVILGLPGETPGMMRQTARFISALPITGVKIHLLYLVEGTPLADLYNQGGFRCLERAEYVDLVVDFLERIPPTMVVHRLTGEPKGGELVAPLWAREKSKNLQLIRKRLEERRTWQGKRV